MQKNTAPRHQFSYTDPASVTAAQRPDTDSQLIAFAVSLVGEQGKVMEQMRCSDADFLLYCSGEKELSLPELHRLVSLIIDAQRNAITKRAAPLNLARSKQRGSNGD